MTSEETSEQWLRNFLDEKEIGDRYDVIIAAALDQPRPPQKDDDDDYSFYAKKYPTYFSIIGDVVQGKIPAEFWVHVEVVTKKKIPSDERPGWFSCSC
jgi:hypothetical protein